MGIRLPGWQPRGWVAPSEPWTTQFDILVIGGGLSGCAAALAAARRGARVAILEPTHLLGGQMTAGGVGTIDLVPGYKTTVEQGIWGEFAKRVRSIYSAYGLTTVVARYRLNDSMALNNPIGDRVLTEMCHEAGVEIVRNCSVSSASVSTTARVETNVGTFTGAVAIEATEDGSFLAQADFPFRIGNQVSRGMAAPDQPSNIQAITQCAVLRRYDSGVPQHLRVTSPPDGYHSYKDELEWGYPYKANYPPGSPPRDKNDFAGFRAYPDIADLTRYDALDFADIVRTSVNRGNDVPVTTEYLTDESTRRAITTKAFNKTLSIIYYLQNEHGLNWAVAQDEGFREGPGERTFGVTPDMPEWIADFPPIHYIRESRRLLGGYTLTASRIKRVPRGAASAWSAQNVAVGTYGTDMHASHDPGDFEAGLGESVEDFVFSEVGPFVLPFPAFVPADDRRLVAAEKNLSMSRVVSSAMRVHPSVTAVGEAAGVIAALAWKQRIAPRRVSYKAVQVSLLRRGASLLPYPIVGVAPGSKDYPAVALAVLHKKVAFRVDNSVNEIRLNTTEMSKAKTLGRRLVDLWEGPL